MTNLDLADPELIASAQRSFSLSRVLCAGCAAYHGIFPYLRLARVVGGSARSAIMWDQAAALVAAGGRRILIAGAGDGENTRRLLRAIREYPDFHLEICDICPTPLHEIRHGLVAREKRVSVRQADLLEPDASRFDIIIADRTTSFVAQDRRAELVHRLGERLLPGGHLLISDLFDESHVDSPDAVPEFTTQSLARLAELGVPVPEQQRLFEEMLAQYGRERIARAGQVLTMDQMRSHIASAGLEVVAQHDSDKYGGGSMPPAPIRKGRRVLFVAKRPGARAA